MHYAMTLIIQKSDQKETPRSNALGIFQIVTRAIYLLQHLQPPSFGATAMIRRIGQMTLTAMSERTLNVPSKDVTAIRMIATGMTLW